MIDTDAIRRKVAQATLPVAIGTLMSHQQPSKGTFTIEGSHKPYQPRRRSGPRELTWLLTDAPTWLAGLCDEVDRLRDEVARLTEGTSGGVG